MQRSEIVQAVTLLVVVFAITTAECTCPGNLDWQEYDGHCYWASTYQVRWNDAQLACQTVHPGAYLATIQSQLENAFISETVSNNRLWIGLNDIDLEGHYVWSNGEATDFTYWSSNNPNNWENQDCGVVNYDTVTGQWDDDDCNKNKNFLCKMPIIGCPPCGI
uniref:Lectin BRA-3 n=1 Tax=Megabalanus rosa TaxID=6680 RepID=LEC3_MEGRO|nr:RecName: Full=Lectin BRA-3; Flags: Precursor [Megabalanus rosa]BAA02556.1 lectin BRA-3 [Megabalanus rosa]